MGSCSVVISHTNILLSLIAETAIQGIGLTKSMRIKLSSSEIWKKPIATWEKLQLSPDLDPASVSITGPYSWMCPRNEGCRYTNTTVADLSLA